MNKIIEIPLSKRKIIIGFIISLLFIVGSIWIFSIANGFSNRLYPSALRILVQNPIVVKTIGIIGMIFFSLTAIYSIVKFFDNKIGLILNKKGIIDNSNMSSIGLIEWNDITGIRTMKVKSTNFILIDINNPEIYILKAKNGFKAKLMQMNMNIYDTPLSIVSNTLKIEFGELERIINKEFNEINNAS